MEPLERPEAFPGMTHRTTLHWFDKATALTLGLAVVTAVATGMGVGSVMSLPGYLSEPIQYGEPDLTGAEDPGEVQWRSVIASLGGLEATRVISAAYLEPLPVERAAFDSGEYADLYRRLAALDAELDESQAQMSLREAEWNSAPPRNAGMVAGPSQPQIQSAAFEVAPAVRLDEPPPESRDAAEAAAEPSALAALPVLASAAW